MGSKSVMRDSVGLEVIYHHFLKNRKAFALIEYLFFNKDVSNEYICRKLWSELPILLPLDSDDQSEASNQIQCKDWFETLESCRRWDWRSFLLCPVFCGNVITTWSGSSQNLRKRRWPIWSPSSSSSMAIHWPSLYLRSYKVLLTVYLSRIKQGYFIDMPTNYDVYKDQYQGVTNVEEMLRYFSLQLGVELNEKCWNSSLLSLFKRISISVQKAWSKLQKRILCQRID